jgi:DNA-binding MarR family transcriptional regulator
MSGALKTLNKMKKANKLTQLYFRKNGPRSFKRGIGALLIALEAEGSATQRDLVVATGLSRANLKDVVKKAVRKGYVTIEDAEGKKTYTVALTEEGKAVAAKRVAAQEKAADKFAETLTADELAALDAICEKLIIAAKEDGVSGKKKGHKFHKKCRKHAHRCHK